MDINWKVGLFLVVVIAVGLVAGNLINDKVASKI